MTDSPYDTPDAFRPVRPTRRAGFLRIVIATGIGVILLIVFVLPLRRDGRGAAYRTQCRHHLKLIMLAMNNYHEQYDSLPPVYTVGADGNRLHSWRTLLLPFLDEQHVYDSIDLSKPWDDRANTFARDSELTVFRCLSADLAPGYTTYLGLVNSDGFEHPEVGGKSAVNDDSQPKVVRIIEVTPSEAVHWMMPSDTSPSYFTTFNTSMEFSHSGGTQAALSDGTVWFFSAASTEEERRALIADESMSE